MSSIARAESALVGALLEIARERSAAGDVRGALAHRYRALQLAPGRTEILRGAAIDHEICGDFDAARLCRRATVPAVADDDYYLAESVDTLVTDGGSDVRRHPVAPATPVEMPALVRGGRADAEVAAPFRRRRTAPTDDFVDVLEGGQLWFDGFNTLAMDSRGRWIDCHARGNIALAFTAAAVRPAHRLSGHACFVDARSATLYYHWLLDALPKVGMLERAGLRFEDIDHWIVRADSTFALQTLEHLGVPRDRIVTPPGPTRFSADRMILPRLKNDVGDRPAVALGLGMNPWVPAWLRERFVLPGEASSPSRLYVSRATRGTRGVGDEPALRAALEARGFTTVEPERLDVLEQAALFGRADTIVAPHGGGLANLAFCAPGTRVVELFGGYVVPCYWALSALAGLDYAQYLTTALTAGPTDRDAPIPLDVPAFIAWLDVHLATPANDG